MSLFSAPKRERQHVSMMIWGPSGSGKTHTAIQTAKGLTGGRPGTVAVLDLDNGRSGFFVGVDGFDFGWQSLVMTPPFTPSKIRDIIERIPREDPAVEVLIIDTLSQAWDGIGGAQDMAEEIEKNTRGSAGFAKWNTPKREFNAITRAIQQSGFHVICLVQAKDKITEGKRGQIPPSVPSVEKKVISAVDFSIAIGVDHIPILTNENQKMPIAGNVIPFKCPRGLERLVGGKAPLDLSVGQGILEWANSGNPGEIQALRRDGNQAAMGGEEELKAWWEGLERGWRKNGLFLYLNEMKAVAAESDAAASGGGDGDE